MGASATPGIGRLELCTGGWLRRHKRSGRIGYVKTGQSRAVAQHSTVQPKRELSRGKKIQAKNWRRSAGRLSVANSGGVGPLARPLRDRLPEAARGCLPPAVALLFVAVEGKSSAAQPAALVRPERFALKKKSVPLGDPPQFFFPPPKSHSPVGAEFISLDSPHRSPLLPFISISPQSFLFSPGKRVYFSHNV